MELVLEALVVILQLALAGFLVWGGWLCFIGRRKPSALAEEAKDFERAASLVLLALLCTTIAGVG